MSMTANLDVGHMFHPPPSQVSLSLMGMFSLLVRWARISEGSWGRKSSLNRQPGAFLYSSGKSKSIFVRSCDGLRSPIPRKSNNWVAGSVLVSENPRV